MNQLIVAFNEYFKLVRADNPQLVEEVYRLRYQIYCEETNYLECTLFPEQLESDEYDWRSLHILLQHRPSGHYVGTVRLVLTDPSNLEKPFPSEELARFDRNFAGVPPALRCHVAEISRLAILRHFPHHDPRRTPRQMTRGIAGEEHAERRLHFPQPMLALFFGLVQLSVDKEITHWYAIMSRSLDRLLGHFGLGLPVIGPAFELRGQRRPYFDSIKNIMDRVYWRNPNVWELLTDCGRLCQPPSVKSGSSLIRTSST